MAKVAKAKAAEEEKEAAKWEAFKASWAGNVEMVTIDGHDGDVRVSLVGFVGVSVDGPVPVPSDAHSCHLEVEVPLGGGPGLPRLEHEYLRLGANDARIHAVVYQDGVDQDGAAILKHAYVYGNPYANVLTAIEMLTLDDLARFSSSSPAKRLLRTPVEERSYGIGADELLPGSCTVKLRLEQIVEQIVVVNPALLEALADAYASTKIRTFELAVQRGGILPMLMGAFCCRHDI